MSYYAALEMLATAAEKCEENAKINEQEGDAEQAALNTANALEYRDALAALNQSPQ
ncbi:hypothetical protein D3C85_343660 [compost metagenome]